jgi:hypothetical protein
MQVVLCGLKWVTGHATSLRQTREAQLGSNVSFYAIEKEWSPAFELQTRIFRPPPSFTSIRFPQDSLAGCSLTLHSETRVFPHPDSHRPDMSPVKCPEFAKLSAQSCGWQVQASPFRSPVVHCALVGLLSSCCKTGVVDAHQYPDSAHDFVCIGLLHVST